MRLVNGNLYFKKISKNKSQYMYLNENIDTEILIIGGGVSGAITAYYMAEEGYDVVLIDKNIIGNGSTSGNSGIMDVQFGMEFNKLSKMIGEKKAKKCINLMLDSIDELSRISEKIGNKDYINFQRLNSIYYTNKYINKNAIIKEYNSKINAKIEAEFLNDNDVIDLKYGIEIKNGSSIMNVYEFTKGIINYINKKDNVRIYEHTEASEIKSKDDYVQVVTSNKNKITSKKVIITEGAEIINYFPEIPIDIYKTYNIVTEPIEALNNYDINFTARNIEQQYNYMRFTNDNRIIFGGQICKLTEKENNDNIAKQIANTRYRKLFKEMQEVFFSIKDITVKYCFNSVFAETKDSLPIIDELPNNPNVYCNLSYGINGVLYSIIGAKMLKEINREYYARDMQMFGLKR